MNKFSQETRQHDLDFSLYLNGLTSGAEKARLEKHLCDCDFCFETFISALNRHLNHLGVRLEREHCAASIPV
jgi:hypothetical protein